jgi:hypothetical protein
MASPARQMAKKVARAFSNGNGAAAGEWEISRPRHGRGHAGRPGVAAISARLAQNLLLRRVDVVSRSSMRD